MEVLPSGLSVREPGSELRGQLKNNFQYLLTCIGTAVELGNIWRFPSEAYKNGGAAFLLAYIVASLCFGLPVLYMELVMGQFNQAGASVAFRNYMPLMQGLGWATGILSFSIAVYYSTIMAWAGVYIDCSSRFRMSCAANMKKTKPVWFNGSCANRSDFGALIYPDNFTAMSSSEEFFQFYVLQKTDTFEDWGIFNWKVSVSMAVCWLFTALGLFWGVKWLGRVSLLTASLPFVEGLDYVIVAILFGRGVTLPGAIDGIRYYLLEPDFTKLRDMNTWRAAVTQCCFSISVGNGGLLSLASYNPRSHDPFRDAVLISLADLSMSVFGGVAVFSILGFMAKSLSKSIDEVVENGLTLAFVAYPEAMSMMSLPWLWSSLFFVMLMLLGISTMFTMVEGTVTCVSDASAWCRRRHSLIVGLVSLSGGALSGIFVFGNGIHWFNVFNEYVGSFGLSLIVAFELILINFVYGPCRFWRDVRAMLGPPRSLLGRILGPSGWYLKFAMFVTAPALTALIVYVSFQIDDITYGQGAREYSSVKGLLDVGAFVPSLYNGHLFFFFCYPAWSRAVGWVLGFSCAVAVPVSAIVNVVRCLRDGQSLMTLLKIHPEHPAVVYLSGQRRKHSNERIGEEETTIESDLP